MEVALLSTSAVNKYRVRELAKDFGMSNKDVMEILGKYGEAPKSNMQALTNEQLSLVFESLTQTHPASGIEEIFADTYREPKKQEQPAPAPAAQQPAQQKNAAAQQPAQQKNAAAQQPAAQAVPAKQGAAPANKPVLAQPTTRVPQKKVVDTRKGGDVNLAKYDERLEQMAPEKAKRMQAPSGNRQKFHNNNSNRRPGPGGQFSNKRRQDEQERMRRLQLEIAKKAPLKVSIPDEISVGELASRMKKTGAEVVKVLMKNGIMASLPQIIDYDTAALVAMEFNCKVEHEVTVTIEERLIDDHEDKPEELVPRAPVVVVMGHVDHGKTSLLDAIRNTSVAEGEAGGITQHIGAYQVQLDGRPITFLDTPGHEAFTSMRARGAMITDIAILVVAADDGIMPQTVESINHAKAANIPIVVAINKIDKPAANPDRVMQQLTEYGLVCEDWGGDTICCPISAKKNIGIDKLLEMVLLTAEMAELKANPNRAASGTVIEARLDKGRGPIATLLVQNGTLKQGDTIIAGTAVGRVRTMTDYKGKRLEQAGPSVPVEIAGLSEAPTAGCTFNVVADERMARELVEQRKAEEKLKSAAPVQKVSLENLFDQIQAGERKELALIVKADVQGSVEAVRASLEKLSNEEVNVRVIHGGVGAINESDVMLAASTGAIIVGFNVRPDAAARDGAARQNVDMRMYRVIYDCIDEIESAMKGMLAPKFREVVIGHAEVRQTYKVSSVGTVAGCYVQDGKLTRDCDVRVVRDGIVIHDGKLGSLQRFKDSVKEVGTNYECGLTVEKFNDLKEGDVIEGFIMEEIPR
ncbi:translation initiation factor IF-2 [uncultured Oscillibacter sp.]|uniref:translation initiation factor IF-2 n=1 Tax=uncultured Oscillibacter sp. TaxID=876091 RepID=UPI0025E0BA71|nr:translation initiation factor IF-2 [uncultured Oscillibacter sp.]